jgi:demethoxyubiquinone hydroxylase (CLK1/Coq7/Cat5 family)
VRARLGAYGATPTFQALPSGVKAYATRARVGRMLNILQVGESVAQNVCARLVLELREEDYRNHAAAQAMDEARHHLAYRRSSTHERGGRGHRRRHRDDVRRAPRRRRTRSS